MRGREGIVDVKVAEPGELLRAGSFFSSPAWKRCSRPRLAVLQGVHGLRGRVADAVFGEGDRLPRCRANSAATGFRLSLVAALGLPKWARRITFRPSRQSRGRREDALDACRIRHPAVLHRDVEIDPHEGALAQTSA